MNADNNRLTVIGRAERIDLPKAGISGVPAKVDTGADYSAIWGSGIDETDQGLECTLFGPKSKFYTGEKLLFTPGQYEVTRITSSFGHREYRYKIKLTVRVKGRLVKGKFTLSDRSPKTYPVLLGRSLLRGKFIVDVRSGKPLHREERVKKQSLKEELEDFKEIGGKG